MGSWRPAHQGTELRPAPARQGRSRGRAQLAPARAGHVAPGGAGPEGVATIARHQLPISRPEQDARAPRAAHHPTGQGPLASRHVPARQELSTGEPSSRPQVVPAAPATHPPLTISRTVSQLGPGCALRRAIVLVGTIARKQLSGVPVRQCSGLPHQGPLLRSADQSRYRGGVVNRRGAPAVRYCTSGARPASGERGTAVRQRVAIAHPSANLPSSPGPVPPGQVPAAAIAAALTLTALRADGRCSALDRNASQ